MKPALFSFDVFGTLLDWRRGLRESLARRGFELGDAFDRVIDRQSQLERASFERYSVIAAKSLTDVLKVPPAIAAEIGEELGTWPPYVDAPAAIAALMKIAPCAAITNSDFDHGDEAQRNLGTRFSYWLCAEESRVYKPNPASWEAARERFGVPFGRGWWHISAYADYDLEAARKFGLTTVFVRRPHSRPGPADLVVDDLVELAARVAT